MMRLQATVWWVRMWRHWKPSRSFINAIFSETLIGDRKSRFRNERDERLPTFGNITFDNDSDDDDDDDENNNKQKKKTVRFCSLSLPSSAWYCWPISGLEAFHHDKKPHGSWLVNDWLSVMHVHLDETQFFHRVISIVFCCCCYFNYLLLRS